MPLLGIPGVKPNVLVSYRFTFYLISLTKFKKYYLAKYCG